MRFIRGLFLAILLLFYQNGKSQIYISATLGVQVPGMQDLKFKEFDIDANYKYIKMVRTTKTQSSVSFVKGLNVSYWLKNYGIKMEYLNWHHVTTATAFEEDYTPPFYRFKEQHRALYVTLSRKFKIPFAINTDLNKSYSYIEGGYGFAKTTIEHGLQTTQPTLQMSYGIAFYLAKRLRGVGVFKYVLTSDVDNRAPILGESTIIDTSGSPFFLRNGAHFDTRYHMFLFGLQYQIF
jgi:hypothetical protein